MEYFDFHDAVHLNLHSYPLLGHIFSTIYLSISFQYLCDVYTTNTRDFKYPLELWERLLDMCLVDCYDEMVRDLCGISYKDRLTTNDTNPSTSTSEEIGYSGWHLARMRRHVTITPYTVFENHRMSIEYRTFIEQQRRLLRKSTTTNLFGNILFEMNNWRYAHSSPQSSRRVFIRPGNYT